MQRWKCAQSAQGICRFCGRTVGKDHAAKMPRILPTCVGEHQVQGRGGGRSDPLWYLQAMARAGGDAENPPGERMLHVRKGASHVRYV